MLRRLSERGETGDEGRRTDRPYSVYGILRHPAAVKKSTRTGQAAASFRDPRTAAGATTRTRPLRHGRGRLGWERRPASPRASDIEQRLDGAVRGGTTGQRFTGHAELPAIETFHRGAVAMSMSGFHAAGGAPGERLYCLQHCLLSRGGEGV
ncbi:hypothetical protein VTN02DRAFT_114 [Thermoascus thermophilus]